MPRNRLLIGSLLLLAACLWGCGGSGGHLIGPRIPDLPPDAFETAPDSFVVDGVRYSVEVTLYRDFMPIAPPDGTGLIAAVLVAAPPGKTIPPGLGPYWIWVRNKEDVWGAELEAQINAIPGEIYFSARGGPKWGPGIGVDVLLGRPASGGKLQLVGLRGVPIGRTD